MSHILNIAEFVLESFLHTWPYLLITIPIAVGVKMSGASKFIDRAFTARPIAAIFLATLVGAFSPLCSCSVIPVVAALLIGGVPLAPVMSFWIASPSMDPEIFFLTVSSLGWELAAWRLAATLVLSLSSGFITHALIQKNALGKNLLRTGKPTDINTTGQLLKQSWQFFMHKVRKLGASEKLTPVTVSAWPITLSPDLSVLPAQPTCSTENSTCGTAPPTDGAERQPDRANFWKRLAAETWDASTMVIKFMLLAWVLGAVIRLYIPETWVASTLGADKPLAIFSAALFGIPVYTSNLAAIPLVGGLLAQGMHPAAALAFLIAGPTTTLPAMSAVWGLVNRKVFALYIGFSLVGAIVLGYLYSFILL